LLDCVVDVDPELIQPVPKVGRLTHDSEQPANGLVATPHLQEVDGRSDDSVAQRRDLPLDAIEVHAKPRCRTHVRAQRSREALAGLFAVVVRTQQDLLRTVAHDVGGQSVVLVDVRGRQLLRPESSRRQLSQRVVLSVAGRYECRSDAGACRDDDEERRHEEKQPTAQ
jgi:hypothetical protein